MNESLTNRQIAFYIFGIVLGYEVIILPKKVAEAVGTGAWISLLLSTIIAGSFTYLFTYLGYIHKGKTLYEYSNLLVGKVLTSIFIFIYIVYFFSTSSIILRISCEIVKQTILNNTPVWALCLTFILVVYYGVTKKLVSISRICELYGVVIILATIFMHTLMATEGKLINLQPFFGAVGLMDYIKSTSVTISPFLGFEALTIVSMNQKNNKKVFLYTTGMILFIGLLYIFIVESCISIIGIDDIIHFDDSVFVAIRRMQIPYLEFLRRLDGLFVLAWIMAIFCTLLIFEYGCVFYLSKWFKKTNFNLLVLVVIILTYITALIPGNLEMARKILMYVGYAGIVPVGIIPIILFIMTKVKKYDKKSK